MDLVKIGCQPDEYVQYKDPEDYVKMELHTFPLHYPPPPDVNYGIPEKWLKIMAKYKFSWRIIELAKAFARKSRKKYGWKPPPPPEPKRPRRKKEDPEIVFYSDQMSRAPIRTMEINKKMYAKVLDLKHRQKLRRNIRSAWESIYNYYNKKERDKYLRMLRMQKRVKKPPFVFDRTDNLAKPKELIVPPKVKPKTKPLTFKDCRDCRIRNEFRSMPKERKTPPVNKLGIVKRAALKYIISDRTMALTKQFKRFKEILPPLPLGKVQRSALLYNISVRTEALAVPRKRMEGVGLDDEDWNPFAVSKWALRYRPTKRIMELSKPRVYEP
ncbi:unnamed protein product [Phyllotreta striolata]|uniref:Uncharacterized protein n=1 Tax=Phyllotreta striolata TaxID=444603 RepID=A0A9N9XTN6_PHYSR|nr:unnamed protein product [Phyllotreta striolata]